jgi:D-alanyl-lipoteichoic acid acyltransferase DltB (MBOAT superfamily)
LGGPYGKKLKWIRNILITFIACGLWHGVKITFVVWGCLHGLYLICSVITGKIRKKAVSILKINKIPLLYKSFRITFISVLILITWVFFRADSLHDAIYIITHFYQYDGFQPWMFFELGLPRFEFVCVILFIVILLFVDYLISERPRVCRQLWKKKYIRYIADLALIYIIIFFGVFGRMEFIYFRF